MLIGYARVSTVDQNLDLQLDALKAVGCEKIFTDQLSGVKEDQPGLDKAMEHVRAGDTLAVWRLDRLGRSLPHLIEAVNGLEARGVGFRSLTECIDTTTSAGKLIFAIFGALAQFERDLIRERTMAGLAAARASGRTGGRKRQVTDSQARLIRELAKDKSRPVSEICEALGIGRSTFYRYAGNLPTTSRRDGLPNVKQL